MTLQHARPEGAIARRGRAAWALNPLDSKYASADGAHSGAACAGGGAPHAQAANAAARFLSQAGFGGTPATIAAFKAGGAAAWISAQLALPASPVPPANDLNTLRSGWFKNMTAGPDQLRQRMIFALSQVFALSSDKNPYADEIRPWLATLSTHAFGNFKDLLRAMTLNPAMAKYRDLGNSALPAPNVTYARDLMQLFTVGPVLLNQDGSARRDRNGEPIPAFDQAHIADFASALSGWTYVGTSSTGLNWENMAGPLQPRDNHHDPRAKTLLGGARIPAGQSAEQDFDAVINNLFEHPNVAPFIATRLIRHFVTSNPSPAYVARVAYVFATSANGRGDLAATLQALLLDPEARDDAAATGHAKDPVLHTIGLLRAMNATVHDTSNLFWDCFLAGQKPGPDRLDGAACQVYSPTQAVARAKLIYRLINGGHDGTVSFDLTPYERTAATPSALIGMVDTNLRAGRMGSGARGAIDTALQGIDDTRQRTLTALYLAAISAEFGAGR